MQVSCCALMMVFGLGCSVDTREFTSSVFDVVWLDTREANVVRVWMRLRGCSFVNDTEFNAFARSNLASIPWNRTFTMSLRHSTTDDTIGQPKWGMRTYNQLITHIRILITPLSTLNQTPIPHPTHQKAFTKLSQTSKLLISPILIVFPFPKTPLPLPSLNVNMQP